MLQEKAYNPADVPNADPGTKILFLSSEDGRWYSKDETGLVEPLAKLAVPGLIKKDGNIDATQPENGDYRIIVNAAGALVSQNYVADAWDEANETEIQTP